MTESAIATVPLTATQIYLLDDLRVSGSESYAVALGAGMRIQGHMLIIPRAAFGSLGTAVGIRADIADEGEYSSGERRSWLNLATKLARVGVVKASPLT